MQAVKTPRPRKTEFIPFIAGRSVRPAAWCLALFLLGSLAAGSALAGNSSDAEKSDAGKSNAEKSDANKATYSTGKAGGRLKWLSRRPKPVPAKSKVIQAQYTQPAPTPAKRPTTPQDQPALQPPNEAGSLPRRSLSGRELEQAIMPRHHEVQETCPSPKDLKRISEIGTDITPSEGDLPHNCPLSNDMFQPRQFSPITYTWTASALCHKPLYFEDVQLERYGHMCGPWLQPFASGVHFFLTLPILPYKMGLKTPDECVYTLGHYRPGNCAPYLFDPIPLSVRAAFFEAGAWIGGVYAFP